MLKEIMLEVTKYKYFGNQRKSYSELENFNDRGTQWSEYVSKTKLVEVQLRGPEGSTRKKVYKVQQSLYNFLLYIDSKSKKVDIEKALCKLEENLKVNKRQVEEIKADYKYTEEYKQKLIKKFDEDNAITIKEIERLNSYINQKENEKEVSAVKRAMTPLKKEIKAYINEKWKYNEAHIAQIESEFIEKNPLFNFKFEGDKVLIEGKQGIAKATVKSDGK